MITISVKVLLYMKLFSLGSYLIGMVIDFIELVKGKVNNFLVGIRIVCGLVSNGIASVFGIVNTYNALYISSKINVENIKKKPFRVVKDKVDMTDSISYHQTQNEIEQNIRASIAEDVATKAGEEVGITPPDNFIEDPYANDPDMQEDGKGAEVSIISPTHIQEGEDVYLATFGEEGIDNSVDISIAPTTLMEEVKELGKEPAPHDGDTNTIDIDETIRRKAERQALFHYDRKLLSKPTIADIPSNVLYDRLLEIFDYMCTENDLRHISDYELDTMDDIKAELRKREYPDSKGIYDFSLDLRECYAEEQRELEELEASETIGQTLRRRYANGEISTTDWLKFVVKEINDPDKEVKCTSQFETLMERSLGDIKYITKPYWVTHDGHMFLYNDYTGKFDKFENLHGVDYGGINLDELIERKTSDKLAFKDSFKWTLIRDFRPYGYNWHFLSHTQSALQTCKREVINHVKEVYETLKHFKREDDLGKFVTFDEISFLFDRHVYVLSDYERKKFIKMQGVEFVHKYIPNSHIFETRAQGDDYGYIPNIEKGSIGRSKDEVIYESTGKDIFKDLINNPRYNIQDLKNFVLLPTTKEQKSCKSLVLYNPYDTRYDKFVLGKRRTNPTEVIGEPLFDPKTMHKNDRIVMGQVDFPEDCDKTDINWGYYLPHTFALKATNFNKRFWMKVIEKYRRSKGQNTNNPKIQRCIYYEYLQLEEFHNSIFNRHRNRAPM